MVGLGQIVVILFMISILFPKKWKQSGKALYKVCNNLKYNNNEQRF